VPVRGKTSGYTRPRDSAEASGCTNPATLCKGERCTDRDGRGRRPLYVRDFPARPADSPQSTPTPNGHSHPDASHLACSNAILERNANSNGLADLAHGWPKTFTNGPRTARSGTQKPVTPFDVTGFDLQK
jgi:hypothetical protein